MEGHDATAPNGTDVNAGKLLGQFKLGTGLTQYFGGYVEMVSPVFRLAIQNNTSAVISSCTVKARVIEVLVRENAELG